VTRRYLRLAHSFEARGVMGGNWPCGRVMSNCKAPALAPCTAIGSIFQSVVSPARWRTVVSLSRLRSRRVIHSYIRVVVRHDSPYVTASSSSSPSPSSVAIRRRTISVANRGAPGGAEFDDARVSSARTRYATPYGDEHGADATQHASVARGRPRDQ